MQASRVRSMARIGLCAALMSVCAWICIPTAVPITLQSFAVLLGCVLLGGRDGLCAAIVYLMLGAVGLPVFSGMRGGVGVLFGPTGGFLFGFLAAALVLLLTERIWKKSFLKKLLCMCAAQLCCYAFGTLWFLLQSGCGFFAALSSCVLPCLLPDTVKLLFAAWLSQRLGGLVRV